MTISPETASGISRRSRNCKSAVSLFKRGKRTYVEHNYEDHYNDPIYVPGVNEEDDADIPKRRGPRGGVVVPFPERLYNMLTHVGFQEIVSWQPHGRCFVVHQPKRFVEEVMPKYFRQSKLTSFQRQVNLYGFRRLTAGKDRGAYYHELFLRGRPDLYKRLVRIRVKGTGIKSASSPATEPDLYTYPRCVDNGAHYTFGVKITEETDTEMPTAEPVTSSHAVQEAVLTKPTPSSPFPVSPQVRPIVPTSMGSVTDLKLSSTDTSSEPVISRKLNNSISKNLSLSSMATGIVSMSSSVSSYDPQGKQCPVTSDSNLRDKLRNELTQTLGLVSPADSPVHSPFPSMISLVDSPFSSLSEDIALEPDAEYRMDSFQEGIQALLATDFYECTVDADMTIMDSVAPSEDSLDPLFLLDDNEW